MWGRFKRQASDSFGGPLFDAKTASTAGGGTALTTSATIIGIPNFTDHLELIARNFASANVVKWGLNPCLAMVETLDGGVTFPVDGTVTGQQNPASTGFIVGALTPMLGGGTAGGAVYIGASVPFRGVRVVMGGTVNSVASVMTVEFWNGSAWVATSGFSDGTISAGHTLGQSGDITFTVPTTWANDSLANGVAAFAAQRLQPAMRRAWLEYAALPLYWLRVSVSATLTAGTVISTAFSMNRNTTQYSEMLENSLEAFRVQKTPGGIGAIELLTDAGTANAIVNCYTDSPSVQGSF